jgi:chemotaxis protein methyltransferase CheR
VRATGGIPDACTGVFPALLPPSTTSAPVLLQPPVAVVTASVAGSALYFRGAPARFPTRKHLPAPVRRPTPALADAQEFFQWLFGRLHLQHSRYRATALQRRLPACFRHLGVHSIPEAKRRVEARPALALELMDVVLLGVSEFRRDPAVFAALKQEILPRLLRASAHPRIWSAACSEGQELYSVAALLADLDALERCELRGTDCRPEAIARARLGEYPLTSLTRLDEQARKGLCLVQADRVRVHPRLRTAVSWRVADLLAQPEKGPWDLVLWRNMAIYLESNAADETWTRIVDELAPGGFIVVGKADYPPAGCNLERVGPNIYAKPVE